jgi:hypothetical protein
MHKGREIINQLAEQVTQASLTTEILYSFIIIICSLMIYFGTKELYELSSHKGIKYFRMAFLFFASAYFFRSFIKLILFYFNVKGIFLIPSNLLNPFMGQITLILFMYFSTMAIFYLLYSVIYKKWNYENKIYLFHIFAIIVAMFSVVSRNPYSYLGLNIFLLLFVFAAAYISYKTQKRKTKGHNLYLIYLLLLFFWILNIMDILIPTFFQAYQLFIYLTSSGIFLLMLYKVLKKTGSS